MGTPIRVIYFERLNAEYRTVPLETQRRQPLSGFILSSIITGRLEWHAET